MSPSALKNVRRWKGTTRAKGRRFAVVVSRFNEYLTGQLLENAVATLRAQGAEAKKIHVAHVPGAFEVPLAAEKLIRRVKPDAALTLSVVIRGKTKHFDQVVTQCAQGVRRVSLRTGVPVILGMVSAEDPVDALERVEAGRMNKGREWALSAIEMANLTIKLGRKKRA